MNKIKEYLNNNKLKIIAVLGIIAVLTASFFMGGKAQGFKKKSISQGSYKISDKSDESNTAYSSASGEKDKANNPISDYFGKSYEKNSSLNSASGMVINPETGKDKYQTDPVPAEKPTPVEPENAQTTGQIYYCTVSISCATILDNMDICKSEKKELVPPDGWILKPLKVSFEEGESVFDVLKRICTENKIHMEYSFTPIYNSAYIEGINNLYEFDVGSLSGWMYKVNDWFPNYGCSRYQLKDGDRVDWVYTCDCGYDVGGGYAVGE